MKYTWTMFIAGLTIDDTQFFQNNDYIILMIYLTPRLIFYEYFSHSIIVIIYHIGNI